MKDWRGVRVVVGDQVIYSTRQGSSLTVVEGTVLSIEPDKHPPYGRAPEDVAVVHVTNESGGGTFSPRKRPARVGSRYLTVVTGLPEATSDTA